MKTHGITPPVIYSKRIKSGLGSVKLLYKNAKEFADTIRKYLLDWLKQ